MFKDRVQAGQLLAQKLIGEEKDLPAGQTVVLGIPRGGVVVAFQVAKFLGCLLDVIVVKKIAAPGQEELAIGAVGETESAEYLDEKLIAELQIDKEYLSEEIKRKKEEIKRRERLFRREKSALALKGKTVIIVDDGAATGATVIAACREVWQTEPKKVIVALPVLAKDTLKKLEPEADEVIFLKTPLMFFAVGQFYQDFPQVSDEEVIKILNSNY